jgi:hypothetical protein
MGITLHNGNHVVYSKVLHFNPIDQEELLNEYFFGWGGATMKFTYTSLNHLILI